MALSTEWSRALGLEAPIVNAPMGGVADGALAAAVSRAGGLGMIGIGSTGCAALLDEELRNLSELGGPFGIGLVDWVRADEPALLEAAIAAKPTLLSVSFGDNWSWVQRAHDAGLAAATQVGDLQGAKRAAEAGVDVVIARMPSWRDDELLSEDPQTEISLIYYPNKGGLTDRVFRIRTERSSATSLPEPRTSHNITNVEVIERRGDLVDIRFNWHTMYFRYNTVDPYYGTSFYTIDFSGESPLIRRKTVVLKNDYIHHVVDIYHV